jgi:hypothetical protein
MSPTTKPQQCGFVVSKNVFFKILPSGQADFIAAFV